MKNSTRNWKMWLWSLLVFLMILMITPLAWTQSLPNGPGNGNSTATNPCGEAKSCVLDTTVVEMLLWDEDLRTCEAELDVAKAATSKADGDVGATRDHCRDERAKADGLLVQNSLLKNELSGRKPPIFWMAVGMFLGSTAWGLAELFAGDSPELSKMIAASGLVAGSGGLLYISW